ncbi:protein ELYS-like [Tubulanus polymorphus]|uniref:protein ELYS-like n=1 Tax=Tubulanus polymorphus TaxID=672921 RepID=UPI003DA3E911
MRINLPNSTTAIRHITQGTLSEIRSQQDDENDIQGKISRDGKFSWFHCGSNLEVVDTFTGERLAAWSFGACLHDKKATITVVTEYRCPGSRKLLVGVMYTNQTSMLCVFNINRSKVTKAVVMPQMVTTIEHISVGDNDIPDIESVLSEQLRMYSGLVAVGLKTGLVFLIDLNGDSSFTSDEVRPSQLSMISPRDTDTHIKRHAALQKGDHLCLPLDSECHRRGSFLYRATDGTILKKFNTDYVFVSQLHYARQIGCLLVGFNFGCFQMWRLNSPVLEYSSQIEDDLAPVIDFVYQEPENDPKNFVYIWVCRGPNCFDQRDGDCSSLSMYQFGYNKKNHISNYGYLYEDLSTVVHRFEHALTMDPYNMSEIPMNCSKLVSSKLICVDAMNFQQDSEDSFDGSSNDLSLCMFTWEAYPEDTHSRSVTILAMFDLNRWYHAQMPGSIRPANRECSFFAFYSLKESLLAASHCNLIACDVNSAGVVRFSSTAMPSPEQHFYPSALSFDVMCMLENGIVSAEFLGVQRQCLVDLMRFGPMGIVEPTDLYNRCYLCGLLPKGNNAPAPSTALNLQREALLSIALEYAVVGIMSACITQWAEGEFTQKGCNRRFLLQWMWKRTVQLKECIDKICIPMFNFSNCPVDRQTLQLLNNQCNQLNHIVSLFQLLQTEEAGPITEQGLRDLVSKSSVVTLLLQFTQMVQWFLAARLLPENEENSYPPDDQYAYPVTSILAAFSDRRQELRNIHSDSVFHDLLMIDGMVNQFGDELRQVWLKEGGTGVYPPASIHALLSIYLLNGVPLMLKHSIVAYFILDLISLQADGRHDNITDCWSGFCQRFSLPLGLTRLIHGMWQLDHKDSEEALKTLLDPMVEKVLQPWHHRRILKSFLYQGHARYALRYLHTRRPTIVSADDVKLKLDILLANGCTSEAFHYQRSCRDQINSTDLLRHFYRGCLETQSMDKLLQLSMNSQEEEALVSYLKNCEIDGAYAEELLTMHYLQRGRFIEAVQLNENSKHKAPVDADMSRRTAARNAIVKGYMSVLPNVQRKFIYMSSGAASQPTTKKSVIARPKPLSTVVNKDHGAKVVSQASLILAVLDKVEETNLQEDLQNDPRETSQVVYASIIEELSDGPPVSNTPSKLAFGLSPVKSFQKRSDSAKKKTPYYNAEAMALLKTPPIRHKPASKTPMSAKPARASTPQSILKVRQINDAVTSSATKKDYSVKGRRILDLISSEKETVSSPLAKSPAVSRLQKQTTTPQQTSSPDRKQLRFSMPGDTTTDKPTDTSSRVDASSSLLRAAQLKSMSSKKVSILTEQSPDASMDTSEQEITFKSSKVAAAGGDNAHIGRHSPVEPTEQPSASQSFLGRLFSFGTPEQKSSPATRLFTGETSESTRRVAHSIDDESQDDDDDQEDDEEEEEKADDADDEETVEDEATMEEGEDEEDVISSGDSVITEEDAALLTPPVVPEEKTVEEVTPTGSSDESEMSGEPERDRTRQKSPLSSGSFMMQMRSGKGGRDQSPDEVKPSQESPEKTGMQHSFTFATPVPVETDAASIENSISTTPSTPARPFVFSPPLTRSRQRLRRSNEEQIPKPDLRLPSPPRTPGTRSSPPRRSSRGEKVASPMVLTFEQQDVPDSPSSRTRSNRGKRTQRIPLTSSSKTVAELPVVGDVRSLTPDAVVTQSPHQKKQQDKKAASGYRMVLRNRRSSLLTPGSQSTKSRPSTLERTRNK